MLATPSMIALMEDVAQAVTAPYLPADHTTVGFEIAVRHLAPAHVGTRLRVSAELLEVDGRKLLFRVAAQSDRGQIGAGTLRRTVIRLGDLDPPEG